MSQDEQLGQCGVVCIVAEPSQVKQYIRQVRYVFIGMVDAGVVVLRCPMTSEINADQLVETDLIFLMEQEWCDQVEGGSVVKPTV